MQFFVEWFPKHFPNQYSFRPIGKPESTRKSLSKKDVFNEVTQMDEKSHGSFSRGMQDMNFRISQHYLRNSEGFPSRKASRSRRRTRSQEGIHLDGFISVSSLQHRKSNHISDPKHHHSNWRIFESLDVRVVYVGIRYLYIKWNLCENLCVWFFWCICTTKNKALNHQQQSLRQTLRVWLVGPECWGMRPRWTKLINCHTICISKLPMAGA